MAAPRKWGYTLTMLGYSADGSGCPAQVGIHPYDAGIQCGRFGLPRASGDTPLLARTERATRKAAPRKWGYTPDTRPVTSLKKGCPAQVGIHPGNRSQSVRITRLPRASGDTPFSRKTTRGLRSAAPRKWGYTLFRTRSKSGSSGCPAQVGIHLWKIGACLGTSGLPRASGDTPALAVCLQGN